VKKSQHEGCCLKSFGRQREIYPNKGSIRKFTKFESLSSPYFTAHFDSETLLIKTNKNPGKNTLYENEHKITSYCYIITNRAGEIVKQRLKRSDSDNLVADFIDNILKDWEELKKSIVTYKIALLTVEEEKRFQACTRCEQCNSKFSKILPKHRDHDHDVEGVKIGNIVTVSNFRNVLCSVCNLKRTHYRGDLACICHGLGNFDGKLILAGLSDKRFKVNVLTKSGEKYYSIKVSKTWGGKGHAIQLIDSFNFLSRSLSDLCDDMVNSGEELKITKEALKNYPDGVTELCLRKGVYCYDYFKSYDKFAETKLPPREAFFSSLKNEGITEENYKHAENVWHTAKCSSLGDFHNLYLICDTSILADVFTCFRSSLKKSHKLDPVNYITLPSFAFDAFLFESKIELELMHEPEMVELIEKNLRGGFTTVTERQFKANNKYMKNFDASKPVKYITYLDMNSLYASQMVKPLIHSKLRKLSSFEISQFDLNQKESDSNVFFIECDFIIPADVAKKTDELPLGVQHKIIRDQDLSEFT
jgi:hypothetical protein